MHAWMHIVDKSPSCVLLGTGELVKQRQVVLPLFARAPCCATVLCLNLLGSLYLPSVEATKQDIIYLQGKPAGFGVRFLIMLIQYSLY